MPARTRRSVHRARILRSAPSLLLLGAAAIAQPMDYDGHSVVTVQIRSRADLARVEALGFDIWTHTPRPGGLDVRVPPGGADLLRQAGFDPEVVIPDLGPLVRAERAGADVRGAGWFDDFKTYEQISLYVDDLAAEFPAMATRFDTGASLEGRSIFGFRIAAPGKGGGPAPERPVVLFSACQHAREWISPMTVMYIGDALLRGYGVDPEITALLDAIEIHIIPVSNPDGYVYSWTDQRMWRKNRRNNGNGSFGVDNNRNWGYEWGGEGSSGTPSSDTYRGTAAFSEPETQAIRDYMLSVGGLRAHIDFHSFAQLILSPWAYTEDPTPEAETFQAEGDAMAQAIADESGMTYVAGPVSTTLYLAAGGANDWVYGDLGVYSWTIELRDTGVFGFLLPAGQIIPTGEENLRAVLSLGRFASTTVTVRAVEEPSSAEPGGTPSVVVQADARFGATLVPGGVDLLARVGTTGDFAEIDMTPLGDGLFEAALPAAACGATVEWYVVASTDAGDTASYPEEGAAAPATVPIFSTVDGFADDFETDQGWVAGVISDTASTGVWERANPVGTDAQPEDDATPGAGTICYITGNGAPGGAVGTNDVDGGRTTLVSPTLDALAEPGDVYVAYARWYSNDQGGAPNQDEMPIAISNDGGQSWTPLETVTENAGQWVRREFRIADFVAPTSQVRLRFVAQDEGAGSIVEAGVDDVRLFFVAACGLAGDVNGDGEVSFDDLNLVLSDYNFVGEPGESPADLDGDGDVDFADLNLVLSNYGLSAP